MSNELDREELAPQLRPFAADGATATPLEANELLRLWNGSPEAAASLLGAYFELGRRTALGPRLTELVRLAVANRTGCPV